MNPADQTYVKKWNNAHQNLWLITAGILNISGIFPCKSIIIQRNKKKSYKCMPVNCVFQWDIWLEYLKHCFNAITSNAECTSRFAGFSHQYISSAQQKYTATSYWPSPHVFINVGIVLIIAQCRRIDRLYIIFFCRSRDFSHRALLRCQFLFCPESLAVNHPIRDCHTKRLLTWSQVNFSLDGGTF